MAELKNILIDQIDRSLHNPRQVFDEAALQNLAESITQHGVIQPILVKSSQHEGRYEIIAGERRWRASKIANCQSIPALIVEMDDPVLHETQLIENLERENLNPIEEGLAFQNIQQKLKYSDITLAKRLKRNLSFIRNRLDLLKLAPEVQNLVRINQLTLGTALGLLKITEPEIQIELANEIVTANLTVMQATEKITRYKFERQQAARRSGKKLNLERKAESLSSNNHTVITQESFNPNQHHRVWDLKFSDCSICVLKAKFLRNDGQIEDICVTPECYSQLLLQQRLLNEQLRRGKEKELRQALNKVLDCDELGNSHLQYLLWSILDLLGSDANDWRTEHNLPTYSTIQETRNMEWKLIGSWQTERVLTEIMRLVLLHIGDSKKNNLPEGLKDSLGTNFGIKLSLLQ